MQPIIKFNIHNQSITREDLFHVYSSSKNYLQAEFSFLTDEWEGVNKTAVFAYRSGVKQVPLEDGRCTVPWEALAKPGRLFVSVFGGDRITAGKALVQVHESGYAKGAPPDPPTPDLYDQLVGGSKEALERANRALKQVEGCANRAEDLLQRAQNALETAETAAEAAEQANAGAKRAEEAAEKAESAAVNADRAAGATNTAVLKANGAATSANAAANEAGSAAEKADASASHAETAAVRATLAAERAEAIVEEAGKVVTRYGVRFDGSANSGETVHRLYNAVGLVANVGTDTETAVNDFDSIYPWSARRRCCGYWNEDGNFAVNAYQGEPGYAVDGSNGEVWVEHSLFYYKHTYGEDGSEEIVISATPLAGYLPAPIFLSGDGTVYQKAYTAAYPMATVEGKATSRSGVFSDLYSLNGAVEAARTLGDRFTVTQTAEWYTECLYMWVEFATRHLQSVMAGATNLPYAATDTAVIAETSANRIVVPNAVAAKFVVGQTVGIGTSAGNTSVADNRVVTSVEPYGADNTAICFDGEPVEIEVGNAVFSLAWKHGSCDGVLSSSGSPVSNVSGKYNCIYRGKERPYGDSFEWISDVLLKREGTGTADDPYTYDPYFLPNAAEYASGVLTDNYVRLNFHLPAENGYVKALGLDERFPWVRVPCESGASTSTWYADFYNIPRNELCAARIGGYWDRGASAGPTFWYCYHVPSNWDVGTRARLSYCRKGTGGLT